MKLVATHLPPTKQRPHMSDHLDDWEVDALCAWLMDNQGEAFRQFLTRDLPSVACKLFNHPINVYGEE